MARRAIGPTFIKMLGGVLLARSYNTPTTEYRQFRVRLFCVDSTSQRPGKFASGRETGRPASRCGVCGIVDGLNPNYSEIV